jgi:hypothetical protein
MGQHGGPMGSPGGSHGPAKIPGLAVLLGPWLMLGPKGGPVHLLGHPQRGPKKEDDRALTGLESGLYCAPLAARGATRNGQ